MTDQANFAIILAPIIKEHFDAVVSGEVSYPDWDDDEDI